MVPTNLEPVHICLDDATITGDEITEILAFLKSDELVLKDEKKRKRTISNRESAKRSRLKKKKRFEELTKEVNRLNLKNQELKNRLASIVSYGNVICSENNRLKIESVFLEIRLLELCRFLLTIQSPISERVNYITELET